MTNTPDIPADDETPEYPLPSPTNPLSPDRVIIDPDDEAGIDEMPENAPLDDHMTHAETS